MTLFDRKGLVRRYYQLMETGDVDGAAKLLAERFTWHPTPPELTPDKRGHRQLMAGLNEAFPDLQITVDELLPIDNRVVVRWRLDGTHKGPFMGIEPTGKTITMTGISIFVVEDEHIAEAAIQADVLGALRQLGVVKPPQLAVAP